MNPIKLQQTAYKLYYNSWLSWLCKKIAVLIQVWIHFRYNCDISPVTQIGKGTTLGHGGIGVVINSRSVLGRNCIIAQNVTLAGKDGGAPVLDDWVYVGANSIVLGGVHVGKNAFIGALTLVNKDVPDNAIVAGSPAKVLRIRTEEEIDKWHNWVMTQGGIEICV